MRDRNCRKPVQPDTKLWIRKQAAVSAPGTTATMTVASMMFSFSFAKLKMSRRASDHGHCNPAPSVDCGDFSTYGHIIVKKCLKRENPDTSGTGGGADDHDSSSLLWGDAGVNAELGLAGISSLARGGRASKQFRV
jgi:hypothetical protein